MSLKNLKAAVLAQLRTSVDGGGCGYDTKNSGIGPPDGQPPPTAGQYWCSVHDGPEAQEGEGYNEETFGVKVTLSVRIDGPWDRIGQAQIDKALLGVNDRCATVRAMMVNQQYTVMNAANVLINAEPNGPWDGFVEPLFYEGATGAELVSGDWFHGEPDQFAAVRKTLSFGRCRRIQAIGNVQ